MSSAAAGERGGIPPLARVPLLVLAFVALLTGIGAGLARLGIPVPDVAAGASALHGPLMIAAFFGTVIALERAVAIGRGWAYLGPLAIGLGGIAAVVGWTRAAPWLVLAGSAVLVCASLHVFFRQRALFTFTLAAGALCLALGAIAWGVGGTGATLVPWWLAFLVLTIAGERLELSRFMPPSPMANRAFAAILVVVAAGLAGGPQRWATMLFAAGLLALAAWLLRQDIARRTVRAKGLTRFIAVCLLSGYAWLAVGAVTIVASGGLVAGTRAYDAALHALALGFVFSMVFGHAPIIFPAVLRVKMPYHPLFYVPLALLHGSLAVRLAGDAAGDFGWIRAGGVLNAVALAAFIVSTASAIVRGTRRTV